LNLCSAFDHGVFARLFEIDQRHELFGTPIPRLLALLAKVRVWPNQDLFDFWLPRKELPANLFQSLNVRLLLTQDRNQLAHPIRFDRLALLSAELKQLIKQLRLFAKQIP